MKYQIKRILQWLLGIDNYLLFFSFVSIQRTLRLGADADLKQFASLLPAEGCILDVGANVGNTTVPLAIWKPASRIHAFEPVPLNSKALVKMIRRFRLSNVKVHNFALGNTIGEITMQVPVEGAVVQQGLSSVVMENEEQSVKGVTYKVEMHRLDDIWKDDGCDRITGMKIDVENFEWEMLMGARALLARYKPVVYCEIWNNHKKQSTMDLMKDLGYRACIVRHGCLVDDDGNDNLNYFFIPRT